MEVIRMPTIPDVEIPYPDLGMEDQFARQKGVQYGSLSIYKNRIEADDGTGVTVKIDKDGFHGYKSGVKQIKISNTGAVGYGTLGSAWSFYNSDGGTLYGLIGYLHASTAMYLSSTGNADTLINSDKDLYLTADVDVLVSAPNNVLLAANNDVSLRADYGDDASGNVFLRGADSTDPNSSGVMFWDHDGSAWVEKTAIVKTSQGYNALYCTESPEVWFMDFCDSKDKIDPLFLEVTEKPYHFIKCEGGEYQVWGKRRGHEQKRFGDKTEKEFLANEKFLKMNQPLV